MGGIFFKKSGLEYTLCETPDFEPVSIFITDNTKLLNLFEVAKYLLLKYVKMYYLRLTISPETNSKKSNRIPIDKKTFNLLEKCKFSWYSPGFENDIGNGVEVDWVEDKLSDVFYIIVNKIIENKLGMTFNVDFDYTGDLDLWENEIEVYIEMII